MLKELKGFDADGLAMDELVALEAFGTQLRGRYRDLGIDEPAWLPDKVDALQREINSRRRDHVEKTIKETEAALEALKSREDKRADMQAKLEALRVKQARLSGQAPAAP